MKIYLTRILLAFTIAVVGASCSKDTPPTPKADRTFQFLLHTEKDFSDDNHRITFSVFIRNHTKVLFDSTLPSMKIKDIPAFANKLSFQKKVSDAANADLAAGFGYTIENVGISSFTDTCKAGETFKVIDFSFK